METSLDLETLKREVLEARAAMLTVLRETSPAQATLTPDPTRWSVRDIAEHITIAEGSMRKLVRGTIERMRAGRPLYQGVHEAKGLRIQEVMARYFPKRAIAPEVVQPKTQDPLPLLIQRYEALGESLDADFTLYAQVDLEGLVYPHPFGVALDMSQWLQLMAAHTRNHARQVVEVRAALDHSQGRAPA